MATTSRSALRRAWPVLLLTFVLAFFAAPVSSGEPAGPGVTSAAGAGAPAAAEGPAAAPALEDSAPPSPSSDSGGAVRVLRAQHTAGVSTSRAPPAGLA